MLTSYPIKINNESIPFPDSWQENPEKISNGFEMENGGRKTIIVRTSRLSISANFTVSSRWLGKFKQFRDANSLTVSIYDADANNYANHTMEIVPESFAYDLIKNSKRVNNTNGLWRLSFELEEF